MTVGRVSTVAPDAPTAALIMTSVQTTTMIRHTNNPYELQILAKGRDLPTPKKFDGKVPAQVPAWYAERYPEATYADYKEHLADFLNGM